MKLFILLQFVLGSFPFVFAQTPVNIQFQISESKINNQVLLGYYLGNKSYVKDSAIIDQNGKFNFSYSEPIEEGVYLIVFPSESNTFFEFLLDDDQQFEMITKQSDLIGSATFKGSSVNTQFFNYLKKIESFKTSSLNADSIQSEVIKKNFNTYKSDFLKSNSDSFLGKLLLFNERPIIPENMTNQTEQFYYYKSHFFDSKDFNFKAIQRSQFYQRLLDEYMDNLTVQSPDSIIVSCDLILTKTSSNKELFKYTLITFLNKYAASKFNCFDKIYVHLVNQYYANGKASWMNETAESKEQLKKIIESSKRLEPCVCGKTAYDFKLNERRDQNKQLSSISATYTIVLFWDPSIAKTAETFEYFTKNTSIFKEKNAVLVTYPVSDDQEKNIQFIEKNNIEGATNVVVTDLNMIQDTKKYYDISTSPTIYILDQDKKIIYKKISAEQAIDIIKSL